MSNPAELLVHSGDFISQTDCGRYIAGTLHLHDYKSERYGKLMVSRKDKSVVTCPECNAR